MARFNAPNSLKAVSGGNYAQTAESVTPLAGLSGTTIVGGNVEQSNTDTAGDFPSSSSPSRPIRPTPGDVDGQQMMSDLINVIR